MGIGGHKPIGKAEVKQKGGREKVNEGEICIVSCTASEPQFDFKNRFGLPHPHMHVAGGIRRLLLPRSYTS
jgi:hypothetical protein